MADRAESIEVGLSLPSLGSVRGRWTPGDKEKKAAWELYVELATRISVTSLEEGRGLLREALDSLHSLFGITRAILREYGPEVARPHAKADCSLGRIAVAVLNYQLRPLLSEWHPRLENFESRREPGVSIKEHESRWKDHAELRGKLNETRKVLIAFADLLAKAADVPPLHAEE